MEAADSSFLRATRAALFFSAVFVFVHACMRDARHFLLSLEHALSSQEIFESWKRTCLSDSIQLFCFSLTPCLDLKARKYAMIARRETWNARMRNRNVISLQSSDNSRLHWIKRRKIKNEPRNAKKFNRNPDGFYLHSQKKKRKAEVSEASTTPETLWALRSAKAILGSKRLAKKMIFAKAPSKISEKRKAELLKVSKIADLKALSCICAKRMFLKCFVRMRFQRKTMLALHLFTVLKWNLSRFAFESFTTPWTLHTW